MTDLEFIAKIKRGSIIADSQAIDRLFFTIQALPLIMEISVPCQFFLRSRWLPRDQRPFLQLS